MGEMRYNGVVVDVNGYYAVHKLMTLLCILFIFIEINLVIVILV